MASKQWGQRRRSFLEIQEENEAKSHAIRPEMFDVWLWDEVKKESKAVTQLIDKKKAEYKFAGDLLMDIWMSLYKREPEPNPFIGEKHKFSLQVMEHLMKENTEWESVREVTDGNIASSVYAAIELLENLPLEQLKELFEKKEEEEEQNSKQLNQREGLSKEGSVGPKSKKSSASRKGKGQKKSETDKAIEDHMKAAAKAAANASEEMRECISWGDAAASNDQLAVGPQVELAKRIMKDPKIKKIAKMAGRMVFLSQKMKRIKYVEGRSDLYDIEAGRDLSLMLGQELTSMASEEEAMQLDFFKRYIEGQTLQYKTRSADTAGKGPIICCVDESGSMSGNSETWAKAVGMALLMTANEQKRNFAWMPFAHYVGKVREFPGGVLNYDDFISIARDFMNGGTDFMSPLDEARNLIYQQEYKKADIVFITDGHCYLDDQFIKEYKRFKEDMQFRVWVVPIGYNRCEVLEPIADATLDPSNEQAIISSVKSENKADEPQETLV